MTDFNSSVQMLRIHYRGKNLDIFDASDRTPIYHVRVTSQTPQFHLIPLSSQQTNHADEAARYCTAAFKKLSFEVGLNLHGQEIPMTRSSTFSRTYEYDSPALDSRVAWEADGALTGDFRLVNCSTPAHTVLARFHNKLLSNSEVGCFEVVGEVTDKFREELVLTGLAELVMMQSLNLAGMVLFG